ncbi:dihydroxyacetone kinase [Actinidia rufa]|uniref:Dihydroxyacetone kinase n=1 Tax=Actinidia rufa TaxID=165716 RepID=A0A7J0F9G3_9ERIC|nr:dihydroxyacetone kinase [Actinidia rufa]
MGGTSGIIYNVFCKAAYAQLKADGSSVITPVQWANALEAAIAAVSKYGGARAGYRTLLDALIPASLVLKERLVAGDDPADAFILSSEAALAGAESTKHMQAQGQGRFWWGWGGDLTVVGEGVGVVVAAAKVGRGGVTGASLLGGGSVGACALRNLRAGRSTYVSGDILATVPDPGAMAAAAWYRAAALAVKDKYQAS